MFFYANHGVNNDILQKKRNKFLKTCYV